MPNPAAATSAARRRAAQKSPSSICPIAPQCAGAGPTTLVFKVKEKNAASGASVKVVDATGGLVFETERRVAAFSDRRIVKDARGTEIGQVRRQRTPNVHSTTYLGTMDDEKRLTIRCKGTMNAGRTISAAEFDADIYHGQHAVGRVGGNWREKSFQIAMMGSRVARVSKEATGLVLDPDTFCVQVAARVDSAFITMVVIALDEIYHE